MKEVAQVGIKIFVTETWRSDERQKYLKGLGLSKVTRSMHQDWLAIDIAFDLKTYGTIYPTDFKLWRKVADIGKKYWLDWWYDLWKRDKPHFQDNPKILPLIDNTIMKNNYTEILAQELQVSWLAPIFSEFEGDGTITEKTAKELIAIAVVRLEKKLRNDLASKVVASKK